MWPTLGSIRMMTVGARRNPAKNPAMTTPVTATPNPSLAERTPMSAPFKPLPAISSPRPRKSAQVPDGPDPSERDAVTASLLATAEAGAVGSEPVTVRCPTILLVGGSGDRLDDGIIEGHRFAGAPRPVEALLAQFLPPPLDVALSATLFLREPRTRHLPTEPVGRRRDPDSCLCGELELVGDDLEHRRRVPHVAGRAHLLDGLGAFADALEPPAEAAKRESLGHVRTGVRA